MASRYSARNAIGPSADDAFNERAFASLGATLAPAYLGPGIDMLCLGVVLCQFTIWRIRLERDERWPLRALVLWLLLASIVHTGFCQAFGLSIFVYGYGDPAQLLRGFWAKGDFVFELAMATPIEAMYAVRAYHLWNRPRWMRFLLPLLFLAFVSLGIVSIATGSNDPISSTTSRYFLPWISSLFVIDWLLSTLIIVALYRTRSGVMHTDRLVMRVIRLSAEAQLLPSIASLGLIIKALVAPESLVIFIFIFVPKIWVITAMAVINFRRTLRRDMEAERERRQNTLNFVSNELDGADAPARASSSVPGRIPTLSFSGPDNDNALNGVVSPKSDKSAFVGWPYVSSTGEAGQTTSLGAMSYHTADSDVPQDLEVVMGQRTGPPQAGEGRRSSIAVSIQSGGSAAAVKSGKSVRSTLGRLGTRSNAASTLDQSGEDMGEMSFEEMLRMKG